MIFHEFGLEQEKRIVFFHASCMTWNMYQETISILSKQAHIIIPALPGHDLTRKDDHFTSVEEIAEEVEMWLSSKGYHEIDLLYGLSMGGAIAIRLLADRKIKVRHAVIDGGITPYQLPRLITRFLAIRDFLMIELGRSNRKFIDLALNPQKYPREASDTVYKVIKHFDIQTAWRIFESCNNYSMSDNVLHLNAQMEYWYGQQEEKDRAWNIAYVKRIFPDTKFREIKQMGHAEYSLLHQNIFTADLLEIMNKS